MLLDDNASTELSGLRQVDIHLVAEAMKWAIRYSEETLVTYSDYQALYLDQERSFSRFVNDLPQTNRIILLDLFALCADITLLAHLNEMTLTSVAKAISLSVMDEPERDFTTFDAALKHRNVRGAACEDLLRAFLRIKTTHDLAKIEQEDEVDENRYFDNVTRQVRSARQRSNDNGNMTNIPYHSRHDMSVPSSAGSTIPSSAGWPTAMTPGGAYGRHANGYFDPALTPRSASPLSQPSLSRSHSLAKSNSIRSRPLSPAPFHDQDIQEYDENTQDRSHMNYHRQSGNSQNLMPRDIDRRRSSVPEVESLYMLPVDGSSDGYDSDPETSRKSYISDFADGLGWDFSRLDSLQTEEKSSKERQPHSPISSQVSLGNSQTNYEDSSSRSPPHGVIQRSGSSTIKARVGHAIAVGHTSPSMTPHRIKRNSLLRRSVSLDPHTMQGRVHKRPNELRHDILTRELAIQAQATEDLRLQSMQLKQQVDGNSISSPNGSPFPLESSPQDLERPRIPTRGVSQGLGRTLSKSSQLSEAKLEINVGSLPKNSPTGTMDELTPVSNQSSSSSTASPRPNPPSGTDRNKFEAIQRPREAEVSVHFTPITPVSPKAEMRSNFHESFPEQPVSPPQGYAQGHNNKTHKRSPTSTSTKSGQSSKLFSPASSTTPSPLQSRAVSRSNSRSQGSQLSLSIPLQQGVTVSSGSSQISATESSKSKTGGFIRALSYKLRSKQSEEQLKTKGKDQDAPVAPAVSIQPPRLELSFLGDLGGSASSHSSSRQSSDVYLPPASAPASIIHRRTDSGNNPESWRRAAQDSLPVPAAGTDLLGSDRPKGFTGARRSSGTLFGSGNVAVREQRRKSKVIMPTRSSPSSQAMGSKSDGKRNGSSSNSGVNSSNRPEVGRASSDSSYTTDDSGPIDETSDAIPAARPRAAKSSKKASEREYRFSTATLLKDGKLYYQLEWEEFSESGFKSEFFDKPEQYLTGLHQKRKSKIPVNGLGMNSSAMAKSARSTTSQDHASGGHLGQDQDQDQEWNHGPSAAQRAAALKAARQSFMALAKDPRALAALKAGSIGGNGQATIIGTGSFPIGSTQPVMQSKLPDLNWDPALQMTSSMQAKMSPKTSQSPSLSSINMQLLPPYQEGADKLQRSTSGKSSSILSTVGTVSSGIKKETAKLGKHSTTAGGAGLSSSSLQARSPVPDKEIKSPKKLFGVKTKASKKTNRLSVAGNQLPTGTLNNSNNTNLAKKKKLPNGVVRKDIMTRTEESLDEVFPWTCVEHMAGRESGWVMLEPVQEGAVGWVKIDKLEEELKRLAEAEQEQLRKEQQEQQEQQQYLAMMREE
ncbi:hypothetical protein BGZ76_004478 [Entomortierella beljakovae]|nr:hypothetical protein BGZ76_004478 [Entomortierella beljakovae]